VAQAKVQNSERIKYSKAHKKENSIEADLFIKKNCEPQMKYFWHFKFFRITKTPAANFQ